MNLTGIFLTGLLTGGLTCMAVQGGLLAATLAQREQERLQNQSLHQNNLFPILAFLSSKLIAYTFLGFLLGYLGSFFQLSVTTKVIMYLAVSIFMIGTALNILEVHPIFRYFVIQPPRFLLRFLKNQTKSKDFVAPALVGAFTVFIPCGTTQAMMALALASSNPFSAAAIMFFFILGTAPLFVIFGILTNKLSSLFEHSFMKAAAFTVILLALFNINNAISLSGSKFTLKYFLNDFNCTVFSNCSTPTLTLSQPVNEATIYFSSLGYSPKSLTVSRSSKIKLNLVNAKGEGCIQAFTIPSLNVQKVVRTGTTESLVFNSPDTPQDLKFTCSMGMYEGIIHVV